MKIQKINNLERQIQHYKSEYDWPKYKISGDSGFQLMMVCGIRGTGKTTVISQLLRQDPVYFSGENHVYYISPTFNNDFKQFQKEYPENFTHVEDFTEKTLEAVLLEIKNRIDRWKKIYKAVETLKRYFKKEKLTEKELFMLEEFDYFENFDLERFQVYPPISSLIFDDNIHSNMIANSMSKPGKIFLKFCLKHRHYPHFTNIFILSQHVRAISKTIRSNANFFVLFPQRDREIAKSIFPEFSPLFKDNINNFFELLDVVEKRNDHSFILMIFEPTVKEVRINFNEKVIF